MPPLRPRPAPREVDGERNYLRTNRIIVRSALILVGKRMLASLDAEEYGELVEVQT